MIGVNSDFKIICYFVWKIRLNTDYSGVLRIDACPCSVVNRSFGG